MHQEDPARLSTYAQCCTSDTGGLPAHTDVVGYNTYYGWYDAFGTADQFGAWADNLHAAKPTWKIGISEYGAGAGITQHADNPTGPRSLRLAAPGGVAEPGARIALEADEDAPLPVGEDRSGTCSTSPSTAATRATRPGATTRAWSPTIARRRKDAFFWYKANWTTAPFVYITSRRFNPRTTPTVTVKVYSNMDSVRLQVNGTDDRDLRPAPITSSSGRASRSRTGANTVVATGTSGTTTATDTVTWTRN